MKPPLHIAILECDTPVPPVAAKYGSYGNIFEILLRAGAKESGLVDPERGVVFSKWHVVAGVEGEGPLEDVRYPDLEGENGGTGRVDGVLITGSKHDSFASTPWITTLVAFTTKILAQSRVRLIGVCFGHQIIGRAMGVKVGRNDGRWEAAVTEVNLSEKGKELFGGRDVLNIHQMHRDIVHAYPPTVTPLGSTSVCNNQGMYIKNRLITVQGHPEFNREIMEGILDVRHRMGIFNDREYEAFMGRTASGHDGVVVAGAFIRFLVED